MAPNVPAAPDTGENARVTTRSDLRLPVRPPFAATALAAALRAHAVPALETQVDGVHRRVVAAPGGPALVEVDLHLDDDASEVPVTLHLSDPADAPKLVAIVRRWLDLDAGPVQIDRALSLDPRLAGLVAARPGLRVAGAVDRSECALFTVLGQQVTLRGARTLQARFVEAYGSPVAAELPGGPWTLAPTPHTVSSVDVDELRATIGLTGARARTVHVLAQALADGLRLDPHDPVGTRAALLALPGIGPWTADYLALRALGDRDAFTPGDAVLRRALDGVTPAEAHRASQAWRPWRAYALTHLWTAEAYAR